MSGIAGPSKEEVVGALASFGAREKRKRQLIPATTAELDDSLIVFTSAEARTTIVYPRRVYCGARISKHISHTLKCPVFSFQICDGDLWEYILFQKGQEVDLFSPLPDYWEPMESDERALWGGNASTVALVWPGVREEQISQYLKEWDPEDGTRKLAYEGDEHPSGDEWQVVDFMRRLGLSYPVTSYGDPMGDLYCFKPALRGIT